MGDRGVGFIGLGVMGEPMAANLVRAGQWPVAVHDVRPEPVARLEALGASSAASVADVVECSDVICLSLPGGPELEAVVAGDGGLLTTDLAGRVVVDHSTAPVALTRELATRCRDAGAEYCDAPVARTRQAAIDGTLSIMVGGSVDAVARIEAVLGAMATDVTRCGEIGAGQVTKLLNNMMLFQNVRALAEAHAIACGLDVELDIATVFDVIAGASGGSFALSNHGMKAVLPDTYPTDAFSTVYALKDIAYALELAADAGVTATGAETARALLESARDAGHRDEYFPVVRRML